MKVRKCALDWILLSKAYKDLDEKIQKSYVSWPCRVMQGWKKADSWFQKWHEKLHGFLSNHSKVKKFYFDELFLSNIYEVWAKKHRGVIFHDTEVIFQNLNQPWPCGFKNGMRNWVIFLFSFFFSLVFIPRKAEQLLQGIELQEKDAQKD